MMKTMHDHGLINEMDKFKFELKYEIFGVMRDQINMNKFIPVSDPIFILTQFGEFVMDCIDVD